MRLFQQLFYSLNCNFAHWGECLHGNEDIAGTLQVLSTDHLGHTCAQ